MEMCLSLLSFLPSEEHVGMGALSADRNIKRFWVAVLERCNCVSSRLTLGRYL